MSTAAEPDSSKRTPDDYRDAIMTIVEELVRSLVPDELRSEDTRSWLKYVFMRVSDAVKTAAEREALELTPYELRERIMTGAEKLTMSIEPEYEYVAEDVIRRFDLLEDEVSNALGLAPDDEGPLL